MNEVLSIRELARQTGVAAGTLRMWEARYGFPEPERVGGGHRRYRPEDAAAVAEVLRQRADGLSLSAAIQRARDWTPSPDRSIFAALRRLRPDLPVQRLRQPIMLAMSKAIEEECLARAAGGVIVASFQHPRHFRPAESRWRELAATADVAFVLADFPRSTSRASPARIALAPGSPATREWAIACLAPSLCACLAGWELPARAGLSTRNRRFESVWTLDSQAVTIAINAAVALAEPSAPALAARVRGHLSNATGPTDQLPAAETLVNRTLGHLSAMTR